MGTTAPPAGAAALRVTVPSTELPTDGTALLGFSTRPDTVTGVMTGFTVSVADWLTPPAVAEITTAFAAATGAVMMVKPALVSPGSTVTLTGPVAMAAFALARVTTAPPLGAALVKVTVPCDRSPPVTLVGLTDTAATVDRLGGGNGRGGCTVSVALRVVPPKVAERSTAFVAATDTVLMVKPALVAPAATVTLAGSVATAVLLLVSVTSVPPVGAAAVKVTLPVEEAGPTTLVGFTDTANRLAAGAGGAPLPLGRQRSSRNSMPGTPGRKRLRRREFMILLTMLELFFREP